MELSSFRGTIFYSIEESIKTYRRFAQERIQREAPDLTVNQVLLLVLVAESPGMPQAEMAEILFNDYAAVARMIELLVKRGYLERKPNPEDRRRQRLEVTAKGKEVAGRLAPVIRQNRQQATAGLTAEETSELSRLLHKITQNCKK